MQRLSAGTIFLWALGLTLVLALVGCGSSSDDGQDGGPLGDGPTPGVEAGGGGQDAGGATVDTVDPIPPRKGGIGATCSGDQDCTEPAGVECFETVPGLVEWPGGYCSMGCGQEDDPECGPGAGCMTGSSASGGPSVSFAFCAKQCKRSDDCRVREGYTCKILFPGLPGSCVPPGF